MLKLIEKYKMKRALGDYVHALGPTLRKRYGMHDQYTVMQIRKTAQHLRLSVQYLPYAVALYRHEPSENTQNLLGMDHTRLNRLRLELADTLFDGKTEYRVKDVLALSKVASWKGGPSPDWWSNHWGKTSL